MMRSARGFLACMMAALLPAAASADELESTLEQPVREVAHSVKLRFDHGVARYTVRRTFSNTGERADEARLQIALPHGAAANGLRIRARKRWYTGDLLDAREARRKYERLTGLGRFRVKDPALLEWVWEDRLNLQVFPVMPAGVATVEYSLLAPTQYRDGRYVVTYPVQSKDELAQTSLVNPVLSVSPGYGDAQTLINIANQRAAVGMPVTLRHDADDFWVGEGYRESGVGYAFSKVDVSQSSKAKTAEVKLAITHTYRSDLTVSLVTPSGRHLEVTHGQDEKSDIVGSFTVKLEPAEETKGVWHLLVADRAARDVGTLQSFGLTLGEELKRSWEAMDLPQFVPDAYDSAGGNYVEVSVAPPKFHDALTRYGRVRVGPMKHFARLEVDVAPELRPLPKKANVVFLVDASRSVSSGLVEAQLAIVRAYLSHVPDAHAEVIFVRRYPERLMGALSSAKDLTTALNAAAVERGNGSALDTGISLARKILESATAPRRIIALSDTLLRSRFDAKSSEKVLRGLPNAITHVVHPQFGGDGLQRDDSHALAALATAGHGVFYSLSSGDFEEHKALQDRVLGLVRPTQIDYFEAPGFSETQAVPEVLHEGEGVRLMAAVQSAPTSTEITGKIWAEPWKRSIKHRLPFDKATAAYVFSEGRHYDLSEDEMKKVAMFGGVVSPVTSFLAIEPGVRPSTVGIERGGQGFGAGFGRLRGAHTVRSPVVPVALSQLLLPLARKCAQHHNLAKWSVQLDIETTYDEIVDVIAGAATPTPFEQCVNEAAWSLEPTNYPDERRLHRVSLATQ